MALSSLILSIDSYNKHGFLIAFTSGKKKANYGGVRLLIRVYNYSDFEFELLGEDTESLLYSR
jgi:hypothetical protein